jgi:hypothetical protein
MMSHKSPSQQGTSSAIDQLSISELPSGTHGPHSQSLRSKDQNYFKQAGISVQSICSQICDMIVEGSISFIYYKKKEIKKGTTPPAATTTTTTTMNESKTESEKKRRKRKKGGRGGAGRDGE